MFALEADGELKLLESDLFLTWHAHLARDFHGRDARATFQNELLIAEHS